jgi:hypothetical protein
MDIYSSSLGSASSYFIGMPDCPDERPLCLFIAPGQRTIACLASIDDPRYRSAAFSY